MCRLCIGLICLFASAPAVSADEFLLQVPGRNQASHATFVNDELVVRDSLGREHVYVRAPQFDTRDRQYLGFHNAESDRHLLWPASGKGAMQIGQAQADGSVAFRPSQMQVLPLENPLPANAPIPVTELPVLQRGAAPRRPVQLDVRGAWFVSGMAPEGNVGYISRGQGGRIDVVDPRGLQGIGRYMPGSDQFEVIVNGRPVIATAAHDQLAFGADLRWNRIQVLGAFFDVNDRVFEIVYNNGRVAIRTMSATGRPRFEPLAVYSAVDVASPSRGRGRLRNGRLSWPQTREEWFGPVWLQGIWEIAGRPCEITQDGRLLQFINEKGEPSSGVILSQREVLAEDWQLPGTLNRSKTQIRWRNGDAWGRVLEEEFPVAEPFRR